MSTVATNARNNYKKKNRSRRNNGYNSQLFVDKNGAVYFYEEIRRFIVYFLFDLITNGILVFTLTFIFSPKLSPWFDFLVILALVTFFTYLFGGYDNFFNPTYGITWETQFVFFWTLTATYLLGHVIPVSLPNYKFWIGLWAYLNIISPYLSLIVRRVYPFRTVFVNHQFLPQYKRRLEFWGFKIEAVVEQDYLIEWLCRKSNPHKFVKDYDVILIQASVVDGLTRTLAEEFFIRFAVLKSLNRLAFIANGHIKPIIIHNIYGVNRRLKRMIDFLIASLALAILSPIFTFICIIIKIDSPGPIFFAQKRPGKLLKYFKLLKFRTMYQNAEERLTEMLNNNDSLRQEYESSFKLRDDPRITKVGQLLRKLSLDEIPQLINILRGEISFVGYRPILVDEIERRLERTPVIFHVQPGATGKWQISGRSDMDYEERMMTDLNYIHNWSFVEDLKILLKTPKALLSKKGAY